MLSAIGMLIRICFFYVVSSIPNSSLYLSVWNYFNIYLSSRDISFYHILSFHQCLQLYVDQPSRYPVLFLRYEISVLSNWLVTLISNICCVVWNYKFKLISNLVKYFCLEFTGSLATRTVLFLWRRSVYKVKNIIKYCVFYGYEF